MRSCLELGTLDECSFPLCCPCRACVSCSVSTLFKCQQKSGSEAALDSLQGSWWEEPCCREALHPHSAGGLSGCSGTPACPIAQKYLIARVRVLSVLQPCARLQGKDGNGSRLALAVVGKGCFAFQCSVFRWHVASLCASAKELKLHFGEEGVKKRGNLSSLKIFAGFYVEAAVYEYCMNINSQILI